MTREEALDTVREALRTAVPGADPHGIGEDEAIREVLEIDSLDFLNFVETLAARTGMDIDEDDYVYLTTLADAAELLMERHAEIIR